MERFGSRPGTPPGVLRKIESLVTGTARAARKRELADLRRLRAALDASGDAIFLTDVESLRFVDTNAAASRLLGYTRDELLALGPADVSSLDAADIRARYAAMAHSGAPKPFEIELRRKDGSLVPVEVQRQPLYSNGSWHVIGVCRDLTEVKRAERERLRSEARYRNLFDFSPLPMWVYDLETLQFLAVNQAAIDQYGFSRDEFLALTIADIRPAEELERMLQDVRRNAAATDPAARQTTAVWRHRTKSGALIDVEITSQPVEFAGRPARLVLSHDVTDRLAAETAMRASNERFELVARATNDIVWDWDLATDRRWWNENMRSLLGYARGTLLEGPAYWGIHPDDRKRVSAGIRAAIASNANAWSDEYRFRHADGHYLQIHDRGFVLRDAHGTPQRMIGAMMDITERKNAEHALKRSEREQRELAQQIETERARLVAAQAVAKIGSWETDLATFDVSWSAETHRIFETDPAAFRPTHAAFLERVHPDDRARVQAAFERSLGADAEFAIEHRIVLPGGGIKHVEERWQAAVDADGARRRVIGTCQDITERKRTEELLDEHRQRLDLALESAQLGIWDVDLRSGTSVQSLRHYRIFGYAEPGMDWNRTTFLNHVVPEQRADVARQLDAARVSGELLLECEIVWPDASRHWIRTEGRVLRDAEGNPIRMLGVTSDITERKRAEAELTRHLTHDVVTGLPRFALIEGYLAAALAGAAARGGRVVVLYVDLDYFHGINETRGRATGDLVLRATAERLSAAVGANGKVAHVAGDEFALIQPDDDGTHDQGEFAETVRALLSQPVDAGEQQVFLTASVGASCFPDNSATAQDLLRQAEAAMMRAKREGRNTTCAFSNDQNAELQVRLALGSRLHNAIRDRRLVLHFQPQIGGQDWQILGFEALIRWQDPELGVVMPVVFIQAAEELGLIVDLGRFVLSESCRQARAWIDAGASDFTIAVNISSIQLQQPAFVGDVRAALAQYRLPPGCIELELTESVMMQNAERMIDTLKELKALGVRLALDDFGTGHSSLNHLRRLPIDSLKIDQSFVRDVTADVGAAGICRAVITLGHQLGMRVVAEGVETAAQVGYLKRNDCDGFQGFYFSRAVLPEQALEMLSHRFLPHADSGADGDRALLLVDDERNILHALTRALRREGYRIFTATNAEEAFDILGREDVQVIVSDQRMPGISGTELLSRVKELHPDTVRLVLSGYTDLAAVTQAINQGAIYKFLTKPWDDEELRMQIRDAFRKHRSAGRLAATPPAA